VVSYDIEYFISQTQRAGILRDCECEELVQIHVISTLRLVNTAVIPIYIDIESLFHVNVSPLKSLYVFVLVQALCT